MCFVFFFSSRRRHTRCGRDWSSDVCSSDLASDANWGRILAAVGRSGVVDFDLDLVQIYLNDVQIVEDGGRCDSYNEEAGAAVFSLSEFTVRIELGRGDVQEQLWTCDFSHEYVTINADYRS